MGRFADEAYALGGTGSIEDARIRDIERALDEALRVGWNEGVEAAAKICGRVQTTQGEAAAIRRLRKEKEE